MGYINHKIEGWTVTHLSFSRLSVEQMFFWEAQGGKRPAAPPLYTPLQVQQLETLVWPLTESLVSNMGQIGIYTFNCYISY